MKSAIRFKWKNYLASLLLVALASVFGAIADRFLEPTNLVMLYFAAVVIVAAMPGRGPAIFASILSVIAFDILFVPPRFHWTVHDAEYIVTFAGLLIVGLVVSELTARAREHAIRTTEKEKRTRALYQFTQDLSQLTDFNSMMAIVKKHITEASDGFCDVTLSEENGAKNLSLNWAKGIFPDKGKKDLIETIASQATLAVEKLCFAQEARKLEWLTEKEKLQNMVLHSISHDLRTPLVAITGTLTHLMQDPEILKNDMQREMLETAYEETERLNHIVTNLLDMTRIEAGIYQKSEKTCEFKEVVGVALGNMASRLEGRNVIVQIAEDMPDILIDFPLMLKIMTNILDNAIKYSPHGTEIKIEARPDGKEMAAAITNKSQNRLLPDMKQIFKKFYRGVSSAEVPGTGLGLTICRGIIEVHKGKIFAQSNEKGQITLSILLLLKAGKENLCRETMEIIK